MALFRLTIKAPVADNAAKALPALAGSILLGSLRLISQLLAAWRSARVVKGDGL